MKQNGSPEPCFDTDDRSFFIVTLPIHEVFEKDEFVNGGVNGGTIEGTIEGATKGVKEKLAILLSAIAANEGGRTPEYVKMVGFSERTLERYLQQLKEAGLIEFKGDAPKTGGYYLTKKLRNKFDEKQE